MSATTSLPPTQSPDAERRRMIINRQKTSTFWRAVHLFGSLQLALFLLASIAIACAVATFYESNFNAQIAQHYIYKAPWFLFWLGLLCINLFAVTLTRWPWQKKHTGFIITHYGIITLLIGAVIGSRFGFEGNVTLHKDRPAVSRVVTSESVVQMEIPESRALYTVPFDALVTRPSEERPRKITIPETGWKLVALDAAEHLVRDQVVSATPDGAPIALLRFSSATAGRETTMGLVADDPSLNKESFFGMATVEIFPELGQFSVEREMETQMVFAKFAPVLQGPASGVEATLHPDAETLRVTVPNGPSVSYRLQEVLGQELQLGAATVAVREFWPDFEMVDGRPTSRSDQPENPAVLVQVATSHITDEDKEGLRGMRMQLAPKEEGALAFRLLRDGLVMAEGVTEVGESINTGWNDWVVEVLGASSSARLEEVVRPAREGVVDEATGIPGFLASLDVGDGSPGEPVWVESGQVVTLSNGHRFVRIGYGLKLRPVPFSIRLLDFEVPRFEGTDTPSNFIATVEFLDPTTGETKVDTARMNRPANWPGGWGPLLTGQNYKFSQAEWNPQDLSETTLQVLFDPGWILKWIGSLAICVGIGVMFYWKPRR